MMAQLVKLMPLSKKVGGSNPDVLSASCCCVNQQTLRDTLTTDGNKLVNLAKLNLADANSANGF